ncbi:MAG: serpin family protein [Bacteroidales bacterium]|nr:serpin family protein [Bacteroidales bacterium]
MKKRILPWAIFKPLLIVMVVICWSCDSSDTPENLQEDDNPREDIVLSRAEQGWVESNVAFSNKLLTALAEEKQENFLVSPYGVANNLLLIANGASENSREQIVEALYPEGGNLEEVNLLYERLLKKLPILDKKCDFKIHTCHLRWLPSMDQYTDSFSKALLAFQVDTFPVFENQDKMMDKLCQWCEQRVGISPNHKNLEGQCYAILANALSFDGKWRQSFDTNLTKKRTFYGRTKTSSTEMMTDTEKLGRFWQDDDFTWAMWPYGNEAFSFIVAMPNGNTNSVPSLDKAWLTNSQAAESVASLTIPKFSLEGSIDLRGTLETMGVTEVFIPSAGNLSGMYKNFTEEDPLGLTSLFQDYGLEVTEEGAKIALTSTSKEAVRIETLTPINEVVIDHPFYFFIREQSTGLIIFMGKVEDL